MSDTFYALVFGVLPLAVVILSIIVILTVHFGPRLFEKIINGFIESAMWCIGVAIFLAQLIGSLSGKKKD